MIRRPPRSTHLTHSFPTRRSSDLVHPNDAAARKAGYPRGKDEAWLILAAEPDSTIALGTKRPVGREELRDAALDGRSEEHTSELQSLMRNSYAVFCLKTTKKTTTQKHNILTTQQSIQNQDT